MVTAKAGEPKHVAILQDLSKRELQALNDQVLIELKLQEAEKKSAGGIVLAEAPGAAKRYCEGAVLSVGAKVTAVKPGDYVLFQVFRGQSAGHFDEGRWFVKEEDLLAVVKATPPPEIWVDIAQCGKCGDERKVETLIDHALLAHYPTESDRQAFIVAQRRATIEAASRGDDCNYGHSRR